jgi:hypothetical protein
MGQKKLHYGKPRPLSLRCGSAGPSLTSRIGSPLCATSGHSRLRSRWVNRTKAGLGVTMRALPHGAKEKAAVFGDLLSNAMKQRLRR